MTKRAKNDERTENDFPLNILNFAAIEKKCFEKLISFATISINLAPKISKINYTLSDTKSFQIPN